MKLYTTLLKSTNTLYYSLAVLPPDARIGFTKLGSEIVSTTKVIDLF